MSRHTAEDDDNAYNTNNQDTDESDSDVVSEEDYYNLSTCEQEDMYEDIPRTEFAYIKIGITELVVSNDGYIRKMDDIFSSTLGFVVPGTPYRTYPVHITEYNIEEFYVHDIVWRAFNGEPPVGWEVRHTMWEAKSTKEYYSNSLEHIDIYPCTISYLPSVRQCLPEPAK